MPLKDRFRRAIGRPSDHSSSNSSVSDAVPTPPLPPTDQASTPTPSITLTKTSSRLSKTLTWTNKKSREEREEDKARKRLEDWEKKDEQEWKEPSSRRPGRKSKAHQDLLRAFEWKFKEGRKSLDAEGGGRRWSVWSAVSGVSPGTSRMNSLEGQRKTSGTRKWSGGGLSREVTREDDNVPAMPATVQEE